MAKKRGLFIVLFVFIGFVMGGMVVIHNESIDTKTFEVSEYQYFIENFPAEEYLGSISSVKDLVKEAEVIWIKKYGKRIKHEKPYQVFYDEKNEIWLVRGTLRNNFMGGVAYILVENGTGKVLAVWHDK